MSSFLIEIPIPSMGATVNEMTLIDLHVGDGDTISKGQKIAEFESDKSVFDYEAPCDGTVKAVRCRAGDVIAIGEPFLEVETEDDSLSHLAAGGKQASASNGDVAVARPAKAVRPPAAVPASKAAAHPASRDSAPARPAAEGPRWTPRALKIAREAGLDPSVLTEVPATGPGGRVSGDDIENFLRDRKEASPGTAPVAVSAPSAAEDRETVRVVGMGYAVPRTVRSNKEILKAFPHMTEEEIIRITGIHQRYYAEPDETATRLAATASEHALKMAGMDVKELDGVILATIIPDQPVPSAASDLARHLGIPGALAFDLNAACSGWLYALEVGRAFIRSGTARKLLVVTAELLSRITNPRDHATAFLFGDGAGAAILTGDEGGHRLSRMALSGDARHFEAIQRMGGGARMPMPSGETNLEQFYISMDGPVVFKQAVKAFGDIIESTVKRHGLTPEEIDWIVPHQANERILRAVSKRVGIPYDRFVMTISKYGNTSAASVSMALGWAAEEGILNDGDKIVFCSVGAGLTYAGGLLTW